MQASNVSAIAAVGTASWRVNGDAAWAWVTSMQVPTCASVGPVARPPQWVEWVNGVETEGELEALRRSAVHERPFGKEGWQVAVAGRLGLEHTLRSGGRPTTKPVGPATTAD